MPKVTKSEKRCPRCGVVKSAEHFYKRANGNLASYCRPCVYENSAEWVAANPERHRQHSSEWAKNNRAQINAHRQERRKDPEYAARERAKDRARYPDRWIRENYKLTQEAWDALLESQGGKCAICGTTEPRGSGRFHVDHDHACCPGKKSCGKCVRGLLCNACNPMIGYGRDNPEILRQAATYLERGGAMRR